MFNSKQTQKTKEIEKPFVSAKQSNGLSTNTQPQPHVISRDIRNSITSPCNQKSDDSSVYDHPQQAW